MEQIPVALLNGISTVGVVVLFGWLVWSGRLVPKTTVDRIEAMYVRQVEDIDHDRTEWRAAHRISEAARAEAVGQVHELLEHARTTDAFIRALPHPTDRATS